MRIDVLTLFPEMFESPLSYSIAKRAQEQGIVEIALTNIRDFSIGDYRKVDDKPYGGGPGRLFRTRPGPGSHHWPRYHADPSGSTVQPS